MYKYTQKYSLLIQMYKYTQKYSLLIQLALNQDNVSEWSNMSTCELLFQCYKNQTKHVGLVQSEHHHYLILK
jgi:hypothetical protein